MKNVTYTGEADFQVFGQDDFAKVGIDRKEEISFPRGQAVAVSNELHDVLVKDDGVFGSHSFETGGEVEEPKPETENSDPKPEVDPDATGEGATAQQGVDETNTSTTTTPKKSASSRTR